MTPLALSIALWTIAQPATDVKRLLTSQVACWNKGDLDGFMATYWKSDELTFFSGGTVAKGWQALKDRYQARYYAPGKERGTLTFDAIEVEMLGESAAMVRGKWKTAMKDTSSEGLFTLIVKKTDGQWRITHDHTSAKN
jgi:uncharacterized protein (TIGR02246 family)